ncbi:Type III restriction-modification system methylation subunit [Kocuria palustris PEL]|uniref:Type III restriction-modification system methylation subunit n=1 Tax=Kocuria palustris PEL TaxID=1236550 RepID=M2XV34_9MICC|nr:DNA methyltransferase [Kocuria palustris]EME36673.1 Type III restriction-modification system methylation subunit [Kocuria palustris PEL]
MSEEVHETPSTTPNFQTELAAQLAELMPEVIADGKVDVEKLKELLDGDAADTSERFGLFWPGKKRALRAAQEPTTATLRPDFENSKDWDTTKNVFIEGDNFEVLKILQKHYHAKIKMIYIDPPYNTGKDFVYPDNYKEGLDTYLEWTRQVNEEGKKLSTNADTEGRYHSNWLNMMYPRLKLARNLLTQDGVIFISIDDHEQENLKRLCNEVFGESNFIATITVHSNPRGRQSALYVAPTHEYVHVYARSFANAEIFGEALTVEQQAEYSRVDADGRRYREIGLRLRGGRATAAESPTLHYPLYVQTETGEISVRPQSGDRWVEVVPYFSNGVAGTWRWSPSKVAADLDQLVARQVRGAAGERRWDIFQKDYLTDDSRRKVKSLWLDKEINYDRSKDDAKRIGMSSYFDYAKPVSLLRKIIDSATKPGDTVLDFFAGSGTTGDAIYQANTMDYADRNFILVQLPEPLKEGSAAVKDGYGSIADISRARVRQAGEKAYEEFSSELRDRKVPLDVGFRSYTLSDTNFSKWKLSSDVDRTELEQHLFDLRESSSADDASADDLLAEILLKQGYSLTERIAPVEVAGLDLRSVGDGVVLAYLDEHVKPTLEQLRAVVDEDPVRLIVLEDAFQGDDQLKTNLAQLCKSKGIELWTA